MSLLLLLNPKHYGTSADAIDYGDAFWKKHQHKPYYRPKPEPEVFPSKIVKDPAILDEEEEVMLLLASFFFDD